MSTPDSADFLSVQRSHLNYINNYINTSNNRIAECIEEGHKRSRKNLHTENCKGNCCNVIIGPSIVEGCFNLVAGCNNEVYGNSNLVIADDVVIKGDKQVYIDSRIHVGKMLIDKQVSYVVSLYGCTGIIKKILYASDLDLARKYVEINFKDSYKNIIEMNDKVQQKNTELIDIFSLTNAEYNVLNLSDKPCDDCPKYISIVKTNIEDLVDLDNILKIFVYGVI